jgi:hypothetical protein
MANLTEPDQLREAVENMRGGTATLAQTVPVEETFEDKSVWEGVVHVFDLAGRPEGDACLHLGIADRGQNRAPVLCSATY